MYAGMYVDKCQLFLTHCEYPERKLCMILMVSGPPPIFFSFVIAISGLIEWNTFGKPCVRASTPIVFLLSRPLIISTGNFTKRLWFMEMKYTHTGLT